MPMMPSRFPKIRCPEHPGRRPAVPLVFRVLEEARAFREPARHRENERHRHVRGIFSENAGRIGDDDAAVPGGFQVDIVDTGPEIGDELQLLTRLAEHARESILSVTVGTSTSALPVAANQLLPGHGMIINIQFRIKQLAHPRFHHIRQSAGHNNQRFFGGHPSSPLGSTDEPRAMLIAQTLKHPGQSHKCPGPMRRLVYQNGLDITKDVMTRLAMIRSSF